MGYFQKLTFHIIESFLQHFFNDNILGQCLIIRSPTARGCPIFVFMFVRLFALTVHPLDYEIVLNGEFGPRQTVLLVAKQRFFFTKKGFGLFQSYLLELKVYLHRRPYLLKMITWDSLTVCFLQLIKWNSPSLTGTVLAT